MSQTYPIHYPQFFTATITDWKHLLLDNQHKDIIINSQAFAGLTVATNKGERNSIINSNEESTVSKFY